MNQIMNMEISPVLKNKKIIISQQTKLFIWLSTASILSVFLIIYRLELLGINQPIIFNINDSNFFITKKGSFIFLIWNLILAWIPYLLAIVSPIIYNKTKSKIFLFFILMIWLFFFPNAPYILTDFVHLKQRVQLPFWYDITLLTSFAGIGWMLGLLSLWEVEKTLKKIMNKQIATSFIYCTILLTGIGIWIGRYLRWNSWDIATRPQALIHDISQHLSNPLAHIDSLGISIAISGLLFISYFFLKTLVSPTTK